MCREVNGTTSCSAITFHNGRQSQEASSTTRCLHKQKEEDADCVDLVVSAWVCACCKSKMCLCYMKIRRVFTRVFFLIV